MNTVTIPNKPDPLSGYFSSVVLALLISHTVASVLIDFVGSHISLSAVDLWRYNTASGLFLGLVLADPVGAIINRIAWRNVLMKLVLGFALGVIIQVSLVTPLAGGGLSRFMFLFIATLMVPVIYSLHRLKTHLGEQGTDLGSEIAYYALRAMSLPDRVLVVAIMAVSFAGFLLFSPDLQTTIIWMGGVLSLTTLYVINVQVEEDNPWLELLPQDADQIAITTVARKRFRYLAATICPGAVLLGAAMHVAVQVLLFLFPNIAAQMATPVQAVQAVAIVGATGLGVVFFGMLAALGFGLGFILLIGRIRNWTETRLRDRCLRLIKVMCFRPIDRAI